MNQSNNDFTQKVNTDFPWTPQIFVATFHDKFGVENGKEPAIPHLERCALQARLMQEELDEFSAAIMTHDLPEVADGLADLLYLVFGSACIFGIDLWPVFAEVHKTNMAKEVGKFREDGKIMKPEGWEAPDIAAILREQGWKG